MTNKIKIFFFEKIVFTTKLTLWLKHKLSGEVIGLIFFEDEAAIAATVNCIRYRNMIFEFLWPQLDCMDLDEVWFQQDGATPRMKQSIYCSHDFMNSNFISRNSDVNWPTRSCDVTPSDCFFGVL